MPILSRKFNAKRLVRSLSPWFTVLTVLTHSVSLGENLGLINSGGQKRDQQEQAEQRKTQQEQTGQQEEAQRDK